VSTHDDTAQASNTKIAAVHPLFTGRPALPDARQASAGVFEPQCGPVERLIRPVTETLPGRSVALAGRPCPLGLAVARTGMTRALHRQRPKPTPAPRERRARLPGGEVCYTLPHAALRKCCATGLPEMGERYREAWKATSDWTAALGLRLQVRPLRRDCREHAGAP
jgi:hypothetical protein